MAGDAQVADVGSLDQPQVSFSISRTPSAVGSRRLFVPKLVSFFMQQSLSSAMRLDKSATASVVAPHRRPLTWLSETRGAP